MALLGNLKGSAQAFIEPEFYNEVATQSLRFDDGSSPYLNRTFSSDVDNDKKMTISVWVKRGIISNATQVMLSNYTGVRFLGELSWRSDDKIAFRPGGNGDGASNSYLVQTIAKFRDVSAWYHIVLAYDSTQGTDTNRVKIYVNGEQQNTEPLSGSYSFPPENYAHEFSYNGANNAIGYYSAFNSNYLDGYLSELNFIDGLTLDPTYFGETKNTVWIAKKYTGSYGTNGYRLEFKNTSVGSGSSSTIGADTSGNDNHWTSNNIVASDCAIPDSPENNFPTLNSISGFTVTLSEGNLKYTTGTSTNPVIGTISVPTTGKWYWEVYVSAVGDAMIGVQNRTDFLANGYSGRKTVYYREGGSGGGSGSIYIEGSGNGGDQASYTNGDVVSVLYNADDMKIAWYKNGSQEGLTFDVTDTDVMPIVYQASGSGSTSGTFNFGQDSTFVGTISAGGNADANGIGDFKYTVPSGYLALCTSNFPEPTIGPNSETQADDHHNTVLYTGNGGTLSVSGFGHQPDWLWVKSLSIVGNHRLTDSTRGVSASVIAQASDAEKGDSDPEDIDSFDSDGFTVTQATYDDFNDSGDSYVAWSWKANGGTTTSHSAGDNSATEPSVSQANTTSGFSIVTYTGDTSGHGSTYPSTFNHGLGKTPRMIWTKSRSTNYSWGVYHEDMNTGSSYNHTIELDSSDARSSANNAYWGGNTMTLNNNLFSIGSDNTTGANGVTYVAYLFADVDGYSKIGKYTGNGSNDGPFVFTGFRPAWVLIKNITSALNWSLYDDTRFGVGTTQQGNPVLSHITVNNDNAEFDSTSYPTIDILSTGFKVRIGGTGSTIAQNLNKSSSDTFIYMAFAHQPFKYANAR